MDQFLGELLFWYETDDVNFSPGSAGSRWFSTRRMNKPVSGICWDSGRWDG